MLTENDPMGVTENFRQYNYLIRVVRSQNELIEKIRIFDAGLDDRIIELFKLYVYAAFLNDSHDSEKVETLFFREDGKSYVQVNADGKYQGISEMTDEVYNQMVDEYKRVLPDIRKDGLCIDRRWAIDTMNNKEQ